jgi:2-polyprenyl-3-methyl-5-hydroxy-6-metoxy-1,4-benzoquinol methylase
MTSTELKTTTMVGLHDFVVSKVLARFVQPGERAVDLGAGSGLLATRMQELGWNVMGADRDASGFKAMVPFQQVNLNDPEFSKRLGEKQFAMVTAVEVIEHVETPIGLLRNARKLLKPGGRMSRTRKNLPAKVSAFSGCFHVARTNADFQSELSARSIWHSRL